MEKSSSPPRYIAVEGPIGAGKTSLARRLAETFGSELVLEEPERNPFLERFYRDPRGAALPTQLYFLFQRARQIQQMRQTDLFQPQRVADFLLDKDPLFARVNLDDEEFALYQQVYAKLAIDAPDPDLVVYLQAPVDVLMRRVAKRNLAYERAIEPVYLNRIAEAYMRMFHQYDRSALLIVNAAEFDPINKDSDYEELLSEINAAPKGRHFFNPSH